MDFGPKTPTPTALKQPTHTQKRKCGDIQLTRIQFNILSYLAQNIYNGFGP